MGATPTFNIEALHLVTNEQLLKCFFYNAYTKACLAFFTLLCRLTEND